MRPNLIGLMGQMGVGKDAVAALLHMAGYQRVALADVVREEVAEAAIDGQWPDGLLEKWERLGQLSAAREMSVEEVRAKPTSNRARIALQWWGTEYRRAQDPDYWVARVMSKARGKCTVVSDVRFQNEVDAIREQGGVIWRIIRHNREASIGIPGHISETQMDSIGADTEIYNLGHMIDLSETVRKEIYQ